MNEIQQSILFFIGNREVSTTSIHSELNRHKSVSIGSLYVALGELEEAGMLRSLQRPGGPERGYRFQRVCQLTDHGHAVARYEAAKKVERPTAIDEELR